MDISAKDVRTAFGIAEPEDMPPLSLNEYQNLALASDKSSAPGTGGIGFLLLGLYGEVGSVLSEFKKRQRDKNAYVAYKFSALEELGDVLWYSAAIAHAFGVELSRVATLAANLEAVTPSEPASHAIGTFRELQPQGRLFLGPIAAPGVQLRLVALGARTAELLALQGSEDAYRVTQLARVFRALVDAAEDADASLEEAALRNLMKTHGRWPKVRNWGQLYDDERDEDERFPRSIEVIFKEKTVQGRKFVIQKIRGVNIGDRLSDNSKVADDYRFHDVFHLAFAAILGWSPVLRALLKLKRKSDDELDEQQDGARAIIAEEGISNWIFSHGIRHASFETVDSLDFSLLKTIRDMVQGYEVQDRPLWMWEHAILEGFRVFRELKEYRGGVVMADLASRSLTYRRR
jgi:NTP pyrophosphatase (non-canonical NTP hydrolase)